jgi:hypothetical protein
MAACGPWRRLRIGGGLRIVCLIVLHPEDSVYSTDDSANYTSHYSTERPGAPVTFVNAMRSTAGDSLGVHRERNRERSEHSARNQSLSFHQVDPFPFWSQITAAKKRRLDGALLFQKGRARQVTRVVPACLPGRLLAAPNQHESR